MSKKYVYLFSEGNANMRELLGGKGANLAEMSNIGLPVPQGFTITTEACTQYYEDGRQINDDIMAEIMKNVEIMEQINGKKFGDLKNPLLVSVRSGARASMPGMMDTILNLGLNDDVVAAMIKGNPDPKFERFVYDSYRRFIQMFSDVVMEVGKKYFEQLIDQMKERKGVTYDVELTAADLKELAEQFKAEYKKQIGEDFPSDPKVQLYEAIRAVFRSWDNPRANHAHGVRQPERQLRHRRRLHPRPRHRREEADGRVFDQRPGRRRGRRRAYPDAHRPDGREVPRSLCRVHRCVQQAGGPLPRHAGHGVHR